MGSSEEMKENKYHPGIPSLRENHLLFSWYVRPATLELKEVNMLARRDGGFPLSPSVSAYVMLYNMKCVMWL